MPTVSTSPPNRLGAMLSKCADPLATISPCIANFNSSMRCSGAASNAFAATTAATAEAADPPRPEDSGMPLSMSNSKPNPRPSPACIACTALPAVFRSASAGNSPAMPPMLRMRTTGSAMRRARTRSPSASIVWPKMSKPMPTLATVAGAKAVTSPSTVVPCPRWLKDVHRGRPRGAANPRKHRLP